MGPVGRQAADGDGDAVIITTVCLSVCLSVRPSVRPLFASSMLSFPCGLIIASLSIGEGRAGSAFNGIALGVVYFSNFFVAIFNIASGDQFFSYAIDSFMHE